MPIRPKRLSTEWHLSRELKLRLFENFDNRIKRVHNPIILSRKHLSPFEVAAITGKTKRKCSKVVYQQQLLVPIVDI